MKLDINQYSCRNRQCPDFGKIGAGNIRVHSQRDRRLRCLTCSQRFSARAGTVFYNLKTDEEKVLTALTMLAERNSARAVARALGTNEDTVLGWLAKAAEHARQVSELLITRLNVTQLQVDELWSFVGKKRSKPKPA